MFQVLFIVLIAVPILEIYLLFQVGGIIGLGWTILIVIATAIIGATLLKQQGLATWARLNQSMAQGQLPPTILVEGIFLLLAGAFLLTPGFFTDSIGFLFLAPPIRKALAASLLRRGVLKASGMGGGTYSSQKTQPPRTGDLPPVEGNVIEGEYEVRDDKGQQ